MAPSARVLSDNPIESEVEAMRDADFDYIFVFRRRDAAEMTAEDRSFIRDSTPNANRRTLAANGTAIVIGSNSRFTKELLAELSKRFDVQDFSKPGSDINRPPEPANANINR